jgi:acetyl esterase/lipase
MKMTPEPTDKLDATTTVAVNGPADDTLADELIVSQAVGFHRALRDQDATVELVIYPCEPHLSTNAATN